MSDELMTSLQKILGEANVYRNEMMNRHTSFRVGGPADLFVRVNALDELQKVLKILEKEKEPYFILGRGTNLLVGDRGYRGCIITMSGLSAPVTDTSEIVPMSEAGPSLPLPDESERENPYVQADTNRSFKRQGSEDWKGNQNFLHAVRLEGDRIYAGAGASLAQIANAARDHGLMGLEFAAGIPGSVGGALVMNAGAYDGSMDQVVESAVLLMPDGKIRSFPCGDLRFGYRKSVLKEVPAVALEAVFHLTPADREIIAAKMHELNQKRREKQPLEYPSAGSTFKRPEGHFAGKLIMDAGLRGFQIGGAAVSEKHCGFVINKDHATAADIRKVIEAVQQKVWETSGIRLEREVIYLGEF